MIERKCKECGKIIFPTREWAYKIFVNGKGTDYFCSWSCFKMGKYGGKVR